LIRDLVFPQTYKSIAELRLKTGVKTSHET